MTLEQLSAPALIALLGNATGVQEKARACQQLAHLGDADAVPAIVALLGDEQLSDYARSALESIPSPVAGAALLTALPRLEGRLLAGVIDSLGLRRERSAVPALMDLVSTPSAAASALSALGKIASPEALACLRATLTTGPATLHVSAAHAALAATAHLLRTGKRVDAQSLLQTVLATPLPAHLHAAARSLA